MSTHTQIDTAEPILSAENLRVYFEEGAGPLASFFNLTERVHAVDDVNLDVQEEEIFGIVGESGCGKSTLARAMMGINDPTKGTVRFRGENITDIPDIDLRQQVQMVFQDSFSSLNPRQRVGSMLKEAIRYHDIASGEAADERATELLELVDLSASAKRDYPHSFSGGQRQRLAIARALSVNPDVIIADEPVSGLDVSIQGKVLDLFRELQAEMGITIIIISHNIDMIRQLCDRVAVMYLGEIVEYADSPSLFSSPQHPYTQALLSATPIPDPNENTDRTMLTGEVPSPTDPPSGCRFHPRCPERFEGCDSVNPELRDHDGDDHSTACLLYEEEYNE
jgi:oligopeptide/dipeptide ABC transporter ATP-binding protein